MNTTTVRLHALGYSEVKTYLVAALFVAGNVLLPQLCHLLPHGGVIWLPIYLFTLLGAYKYGWRAGLLVAVASPVVNAACFGMPPASALPAILAKSILLAAAAGYAAARFRKVSIPLLAGVVAAYQIVGSLAEWAFTGSLAAAVQDFETGIPGMLFQVFGGWAILRYLLKN